MPASALIVEDDVTTRQALRLILEREGFAVDVAVDGENAVGCLAQRRYDVILLDIVLPKMSGADVMEHLAMTTPEQLERVIVVTGLDVQEIRNLFPTVSEALSKPVIPTRLLAAIRRFRNHRASSVA
ncbi:MAG TPA: response regulator [Thermoanaerobaculia bacterium]|nr:response regulator [Thermoanaerobaculia bacterium]